MSTDSPPGEAMTSGRRRLDSAGPQDAAAHTSLSGRPMSQDGLAQAGAFASPNVRRDVLICLALVLGTLCLYAPVLGNGFVGYDDPVYVTENAHVQRGLTWENVRWAFRTG